MYLMALVSNYTCRPSVITSTNDVVFSGAILLDHRLGNFSGQRRRCFAWHLSVFLFTISKFTWKL